MAWWQLRDSKNKKLKDSEKKFLNRILYAGANSMYRSFEALCQEGVNYGYQMPEQSNFPDPYIREILKKYK